MNNPYWTTTKDQPQAWLTCAAYPKTTWAGWSTTDPFETLAAGFDRISLKQMDGVALLNRIDTKFVLSSGQLLTALANLQQDYWMLEVAGQRLNHYQTQYFDTPDFALYHAHVNGRAERYKVRSREYTDTHLAFLEVKHKTRKDRTIKERIPTGFLVNQMTPDMKTWLHGIFPLDGGTLRPALENTFTRMTLVSKQCCERVTLDIELAFSRTGKTVMLDGIAIAEIKMDAENHRSPFLAQMRAQRIRQHGFSKYAIGTAMLYDQVKKNALKPQLLRIEKMRKGRMCDE